MENGENCVLYTLGKDARPEGTGENADMVRECFE